ncbi:MAG: hypothetical protein J4F31_10310 [Flavobacteriales bacterium]|nr:hypothetical protein [Flavobacteriales bacterium]
MPIVINEAPTGPILADDPHLVRITGDGYIDESLNDDPSAIIFNVPNLPNTGDVFHFAIPSLNIDMTFEAIGVSPDADDTLQFFDGTGYVSVTDYIDDEVIPILLRNPILMKYFAIYRSDVNKFKLEVRDYDNMPPYTLTVEAGQPWSLTQENLLFKDYYIPEYAIVLEVWLGTTPGLSFSANDWTFFQRVSKTVDESGVAKFDLSRITRNLPCDLELPAGGTMVRRNSVVNYIGLRAYDRKVVSTSHPTYYGVQDTEILIWTFAGGTPKWKSPSVDLLSRWNSVDSQERWLTWFNYARRVRQNQKAYLYYVHANASSSNIYLRCTVTYTDGTSESFTVGVDEDPDPKLDNMGWYDVIQVDVSWAQFESQLDSEKTMDSYELWIAKNMSTSDILSPKMPFKVDRRRRKSERLFLYRNSFGVFENLRFDGDSFEGVKVETELAARVLEAGYDTDFSEIFVNKVRAQRSLEASTGFLSRNELDHFVDFVLSDEVYLWYEGGWVPVIAERREVDLYAGKEFFKGVTMKFLIDSEQQHHA